MAGKYGFRQITSTQDIKSFIVDKIEAKKAEIVKHLCFIGEGCINAARQGGSYTDRTGNLRSSIGYVVVCDGKVVTLAGFEHVSTPDGNGKEGVEKGKQFVQDVANKYQSGIALIVVAGMNYAVYVHNKGYDVLDSAEMTAEREISRMLSQLGIKNK